MKKLLVLLLFVSSFAFGQKNALNDAVRANTPAPGIIGDALDGARALTATGTDTYVIATAAAFQPYAGSATYAAGDMWTIVFTNANTSTTTSVNIDSEGAIALKDNEGNDLAVGDLKAGGTYKFRYTGTNFRMIGSAGTVVTASNAITKTGNVFSLGGSFNQNTTHDGNGFHWTVGASSNRLGNWRSWSATLTFDASTAVTLQVGSSAINLGTTSAGLSSASGAISLNPTNLLVSDSRGTPKGLEYNADYSGGFGPRSIVDKAYVDAAAGGGGSVTSVSSANSDATVATGTTTPVITIVSAPKWTTGRTLAITGDLAYTSPSLDGSGNVTAAGVLATVNSNVGSFGSATQSLTATVNAKGLVTAISAQTITPAIGSVTGLGTGVSTALAVNTGSSGAFVVNGGPLGTPSSGVATSLTGLPLTTGVTGTLLAANGGTGVANSNTITLAGNLTHAGAFTQTFTATANTSVTLPTTGTLSTLAGTETLTNKRFTPRIQTVTSSATVTPSADSDDGVKITAQAANLTLANPSGTPTSMQPMIVRLKDNGVARTITYGSQYRAVGISLPSSTVISKQMYFGMVWNSDDSKWDIIGYSLEP